MRDARPTYNAPRSDQRAVAGCTIGTGSEGQISETRIDVHRHDGFMQELQPHQCGVAGSSTCIYVIENGGRPSVCLIKSTEKESLQVLGHLDDAMRCMIEKLTAAQVFS